MSMGCHVSARAVRDTAGMTEYKPISSYYKLLSLIKVKNIFSLLIVSGKKGEK